MDELIEISSGDIESDILNITPLCTAGVGVDVDEPGLLVGVVIDPAATTPYIDNGLLHLLPGGFTEVEYSSTISKPEIVGTKVRHPFARSINGSSVAGVIGGLEVTSSVLAPSISDNGVIQLTLADSSRKSAGLISGLRTSSVLAPELKNGEICLPLQSLMVGVVDENGNYRRWEDLAGYQYETVVARVAIPGLSGGDVSSPASGIALSVFQVGSFVKFSLYTYT